LKIQFYGGAEFNAITLVDMEVWKVCLVLFQSKWQI